MTGKGDPEKAEEQKGNSRRIPQQGRVVSYNVNEEERPDEMKVRFKIRIATGKRGQAIDARQADVIREVLEWARQHRAQDQ